MSDPPPPEGPGGWLPPDQVETSKWPIVGERAPLPQALDPATWSLEITGALARPTRLSWADVQAWPREQLTLDLHCVTRWSKRAVTFEGVSLAWLLAPLGVAPAATSARFVAWSERDHDTSLPLATALADSWLVHSADGAPLSVARGGPLRVITRGRYLYKSLKWLRTIELCETHRLGYWEREDGYHDGADPWAGDQRYTSGNLTPAQVERFKGQRRFVGFFDRTVRRADLRGWRPLVQAIGPVRLKGCDLRGAQLGGCDLRGANLSLSDLRGADLRGADLRGADLEGVRLGGCDLRDADLRGVVLTAASFSDPAAGPARIEGCDLRGATGLLDDARAWLHHRGVPLAPDEDAG